MNKKLIAIISAVALVGLLAVAASFAACGDNNPAEEDTSSNTQVNIPGDESGSENNVTPNEELTFTDCDAQDVYVLHANGAVNLRSNPDYTATSIKVSVNNGTKLSRVAVSTNGEWSKVVYEENVYYIVTKALTTFANLDEGFVACDKTLTKAEGSLTIRIEPAMSEKDPIGWYKEGDTVKVVAENATTGWYKVEFVNSDGNTVFGYIASDAKYFVGAKDETSEESSSVETETETETETEAKAENSGK